MKKWHDTEKEVEIPSKRAHGHGRKKYGAAPPDIIPVPEIITHFVMNLPATAIEFLGKISMGAVNVDALRGLYFRPITDTPLPMVHVYCFQSPKEAEDTILKEVREALGFEIEQSELTIHNVRNVSPNKV